MSEAKSRTGKAPVIEQVAELAMRLSQPHLADYGAARSRHDFTQRQLLSCLVLRAYLKATYLGCWTCWPRVPPCVSAWA